MLNNRIIPDRKNLPPDVHYDPVEDYITVYDKGVFLFGISWEGYINMLNHPLIHKAYEEFYKNLIDNMIIAY